MAEVPSIVTETLTPRERGTAKNKKEIKEKNSNVCSSYMNYQTSRMTKSRNWYICKMAALDALTIIVCETERRTGFFLE